MATNWITRTISSGLQKLVLLNLDHAPALDVLAEGTLPAWVEAVTAGKALDEARDEPRMREAFRRLMGSCSSWPTPRQFLDAMPPLVSEAPRQFRLPSEQSKRVGMQHIAEISAKLGIERPGTDA